MTDHRNDMRQIIVEFTKPKAWFVPVSWAIRFFQWRWWRGDKWESVPSHVRVKFFDKHHEVWWIYEASDTHVKFIGDNEYANKIAIVAQWEIYVDKEIKKELVVWVNNTTGMPYGFMQLIGLGLVKIFKLINVEISNPFADGVKRAVCTEAIYRLLKHVPKFQEVLSKYEPDSVDLYDTMDILEEVL